MNHDLLFLCRWAFGIVLWEICTLGKLYSKIELYLCHSCVLLAGILWKMLLYNFLRIIAGR